jgi:hypothetical protein
MKNIKYIICALLLITIVFTNIASALVVELKYDDGNLDGGNSFGLWGLDSFSYGFDGGPRGQAVMFSPGQTNFTINTVRVLGKKYGLDSKMRIEIWDDNKKVVYKKIYNHSDHFKYTDSWIWGDINIPNVKVSGDFYVVLFTGSMNPSNVPTTGIYIGYDNSTITGRSYEVDNYSTIAWISEIPQSTTNWMIRVIGDEIPPSNNDIVAYYRGLGQYPNTVETSDLLKAADDWRNNIIPSGFSVSIATSQLLTLADEWRSS